MSAAGGVFIIRPLSLATGGHVGQPIPHLPGPEPRCGGFLQPGFEHDDGQALDAPSELPSGGIGLYEYPNGAAYGCWTVPR